MFQFLNNIRFSANTEIVCLLILGILFQISDGSPFQIKQQLEAVWSTDLPKEHFSPLTQQIIKTVLSIIVAVRCGTTSPYVVSAMIVIFCVLKDRAPKLMLLWLLIAAVKSVFMTFLEALTGVYVCSAFGKIRKACIEFFISKALEIIFAAYLWGSVLTIYQDMERRMENNKVPSNFEISYFKKLDFKRQRARSLVDESTLYKTACLNKFEFRDVPQIILQMLRRTDEISQDSLLGPGMMLASVSNMGSFDNLKVSESLGELGYTNLASTEVVGMDDEENLSPPEKALKFLKMTWSDVRRIRQNRVPLRSDIFSINSDTWSNVTLRDTTINKPKEPRTEVCIRELPQLETDEDRIFSKKHITKLKDFKLGISLFNLIKKLESDTEHEESLIGSDDEETEEREGKEDPEMSQIFMSNMKEEKPVNRIRLFSIEKRVRGMSYYKLYTKDFMSVIGPEVFDRAPKLVKVTSFSVINSRKKKMSLEKSSSKQQLNIVLPLEDSDSAKVLESAGPHVEISSRVTNIKQEKKSSMEKRTVESVKKNNGVGKKEPERKNSEPRKLPEKAIERRFCSPPADENLDKKSQTKFRSPYCRKRRVIIRRIGKSKKSNLTESVSTNSGLSNTSHETFQSKPPSGTNLFSNPKVENISNYKLKTSISSISSEKNEKSKKYDENRELHFLAELLRRPLPEVMMKYYDLKNKVSSRKKLQMISKKQLEFVNNLYKLHYLKRFQEMWYSGGKHNKVWKSKVLKTAETQQQPIRANLLKAWDHDVTNKLLKYQCLYLMNKLKENIIHDMLPYINIEGESSQNQDSPQQISTISDSKKPKKAAGSFSANSIQENIIIPESGNEILHANENYLNETPSERSIEVCLKDLTGEENQNSEQNSESYSNEGSKTSLEKTELLERVKDGSLYSEESDEPISLYYSKAANLASPLLDMKKFIYPDHIHYSYKHVKKKGFDVNIDEALPLLVQNQPCLLNKPLKKEILPKPEFQIKSRPMDLSFANTNAFGWENSDETVSEPCSKKETSNAGTISGKEKEKYSRKKRNNGGKKFDDDEERRLPKNSHQVYFAQNYVRLMKMQNRLKKKEKQSAVYSEEEITPVQISSTQLHSNKGRISSTYSPALRLAENKKEEKKKTETQEKRKKDMLARLERQILFQNKNGFTSRKPL